jgi:antitoxin MazE
MRARVQRRGDELVVVIPEEMAKEERIKENQEVEVRDHSRVVVSDLEAISAIDPTTYMTLEEMIEQITPETLHEYIDLDPPVGKEVW